MTRAIIALVASGLGIAGTAQGQVYGPYSPNPIWAGGVPGSVSGVFWPQVNFGTYYGWATPNFSWDNPYYGLAEPYMGWSSPYSNSLAVYQNEALFESNVASDYLLAQGSYDIASMGLSTNAAAGAMVNNSLNAMGSAGNTRRGARHSERYDVHSGRAWSGGRPSASRLVDVTSRDGDVLWPLSAPSDGDLSDKRRAASESIKDAVVTFRSSGGKVPIDEVASALRRLNGYADPAVEHLRATNPSEVGSFIDFVRSLDRGLRLLVGNELSEVPRPKAVTNPLPAKTP